MRLVVVTVCILVLSTHTAAADRAKTVAAGQTTRVAVYTAWDPVYCGSVHGVVKVAVRPQHERYPIH